MLGRYLRADPIGLDGGINLYAYVQGNPLKKTDKKGLYNEGDFWYDAWTGERGPEYNEYEEQYYRAIKEAAKAEGECLVCNVECTALVLIGSKMEDAVVEGIVSAANKSAKRAAAKLAAKLLKEGLPVYNLISKVEDARGIYKCISNCSKAK
jgi:uncharacterized protein RhaS with RHS repeats